MHNHWDGLQTFLTDGRVEIDSNRVENLRACGRFSSIPEALTLVTLPRRFSPSISAERLSVDMVLPPDTLKSSLQPLPVGLPHDLRQR
uniref:IS66 family transposase n=1 Tax=Cereibacter ovatus TaxID=439529 RepID=UPI0022876652|nr:hypothetical protein [Cereibacter ovatus]